MKKQKIFVRIAYISIGLSILVIIGLTIFQQWQIRKSITPPQASGV